MDALGPCLRQEFREGPERGGMGMTDGYCLASLMRVFGGNFQLTAHGGYFLNIIEKRNVTKGAGHASVLCRIISHRSGSGATVNKEELVIAKHGHEVGHQLRIGRRERALMVVHSGRKRNSVEH